MRPQRQAGFTLIELVVSTAVMMIVTLFAIQMLGETGRLFSNAQVELVEPSLDLATRSLRRDAQGASQLGVLSHEPTAESLSLWGNVEGMIRYEKLGSNLDRVILGMEGEELGRRTVMRGVVEWQWRAIDAGLVEVQFLYQNRLARQGRPAGGSPTEFRLNRAQHRFALRGIPRSNW